MSGRWEGCDGCDGIGAGTWIMGKYNVAITARRDMAVAGEGMDGWLDGGMV